MYSVPAIQMETLSGLKKVLNNKKKKSSFISQMLISDSEQRLSLMMKRNGSYPNWCELGLVFWQNLQYATEPEPEHESGQFLRIKKNVLENANKRYVLQHQEWPSLWPFRDQSF